MRRLAGTVLLTALAAACTPEAAPPPDVIATAEPPAGTPTEIPSPEETLIPSQTCAGLGRAPRAGQVTFVSEGRLRALSPDGTRDSCLADLGSADVRLSPVRPLLWNAPADRLLVDGHALARDLTTTHRLSRDPDLTWSRPSGTSIVWVDRDGRLLKRSSFGGRAADISFLERHDDVTYHPAGTHLATSGRAANGDYGLWLSTNVGEDQQLLAIGEAARYLTELRFSEDGLHLFYTARHGPHDWHLHRLRIGDEPVLQTLAKGKANFTYTVSPFDAFRLAWFQPGDCAAGKPGTLKLKGFGTGGFDIPPSFEKDDLRPVGWLPNGALVVRRSPVGCSTAAPQDIVVFSRRTPTVLIQEVGATAALRVKLPPPPPPPGEEQEVVA